MMSFKDRKWGNAWGGVIASLLITFLVGVVGCSQGPSPPSNDQEPLPLPQEPPTATGGPAEAMGDPKTTE
jgi:hypothetical protein